jgi:hypothetical protein
MKQMIKQERNSNQVEALLGRSNMGIDQSANQRTDQRADEVSYRGAMLAPKNLNSLLVGSTNL